jgi:hypothetical protein
MDKLTKTLQPVKCRIHSVQSDAFRDTIRLPYPSNSMYIDNCWTVINDWHMSNVVFKARENE